MKVCVLDPSLFTLPYDQHLCAALSEAGLDVTLCGRPLRAAETAYPHRYPFHHMFYRVTEGIGRRLRFPGARSGLKSAEHLWCTWRLGAWLRREAFDVVHVQWSPIPLIDRWAWRVWRRARGLVFTVHDTEPFLGQASSPGQRLGWWGLLDVAQRLVVHTEKSRNELAGMGVSPGRITRVPHGPLYPVHHADGAARARVGDGIRTILVFGEIKRYKGIDVLLRAAARVPPEVARGWRILIAGRPRMDVTGLRALAHRSAIPVEWRLGFVPDEEMVAMFRSADLMVFPYRNIDASGVLMMALPFGLPVLASEIGVFAELLAHGESALLVPPGDEGALAGALTQAMADAGLRERLRRGLARCLDGQLSWRSIAHEHIRAYEAVLAARERRARIGTDDRGAITS